MKAETEFKSIKERSNESFASVLLDLAKSHERGALYVYDNYKQLQELWKKKRSRFMKSQGIVEEAAAQSNRDYYAKANLLDYIRTIDPAAYDERVAAVDPMTLKRAGNKKEKQVKEEEQVGKRKQRKEEEKKEEESKGGNDHCNVNHLQAPKLWPSRSEQARQTSA